VKECGPNKAIVALCGYATILGIHASETRAIFTEMKFPLSNINEESHSITEMDMYDT
jgi:hypothetical protein